MPIIQTQISAGKQPTGTKTITGNGIVDVSDYANADVQVPTTAPNYYYEYSVNNGTVSKPYYAFNFNGITTVGNNAFYGFYSNKTIPSMPVIDLSGITAINANGCYQMFSGCSGNFSVNLSGITTIGSNGCYQMFSGAYCISVDLSSLTTINNTSACYQMFNNSSITNTDLSNLTTISGNNGCYYMFYNCNNLTSIDLSSLTTISGNSACYYMFYNCRNLPNIDLSNLTTVSGSNACYGMFQGCSSLSSVNLSNLETVSGSSVCYGMFASCTNLTTIDLSNLETVSGSSACSNMFSNCNGLTNITFNKLSTIEYSGLDYMFNGCTSLQTLYFPALVNCPNKTTRSYGLRDIVQNSSIEICDMRNLRYVGDYGYLDNMLEYCRSLRKVNFNALEHIGYWGARAMFWDNITSNSLTEVYFPMLTDFSSTITASGVLDPFNGNLLAGRAGVTVHFRKDAQIAVEALRGYNTLFEAGADSSILFDLAGTLTGADGNVYTRSEKDSVYASETAGAAKTATAWTYNDTVYYTNGAVEPQVNDTIYSDSTLTTPITTIDLIA